jgi:hypothetical protein
MISDARAFTGSAERCNSPHVTVAEWIAVLMGSRRANVGLSLES